MKPLCAVEGCDRPVDERIWCHGHYERWRRTGVEPTKPFLDTFEKRFFAKVHKADNGCWIWQGATDGGGRYGQISHNKTVKRAHRAAYEEWVGPVGDGFELDHLCRTTRCVNPHHLEPVTHYENVMRGESLQAKNARKTHCVHGHELPPYVPGGNRQCAECRAIRNAEASLRRKETAA
jgi:hypothetical protein